MSINNIRTYTEIDYKNLRGLIITVLPSLTITNDNDSKKKIKKHEDSERDIKDKESC